jgi:hypothetical protein
MFFYDVIVLYEASCHLASWHNAEDNINNIMILVYYSIIILVYNTILLCITL